MSAVTRQEIDRASCAAGSLWVKLKLRALGNIIAMAK